MHLYCSKTEGPSVVMFVVGNGFGIPGHCDLDFWPLWLLFYVSVSGSGSVSGPVSRKFKCGQLKILHIMAVQ